jgi:hypothetical protein
MSGTQGLRPLAPARESHRRPGRPGEPPGTRHEPTRAGANSLQFAHFAQIVAAYNRLSAGEPAGCGKIVPT